MNFSRSCALLALLSTSSTVSAFTSGAGRCAVGQSSVGSIHLSMLTITTGTLEDGGYVTTVNGQTASTAGTVTASVGMPFDIEISGPDFKGVLIMVAGQDDTVLAAGAGLQLNAIGVDCLGTASISQTTSVAKSSAVGTATIDAPVLTTLELNIVVTNSGGLSTYYYSQVVLDVKDAGAALETVSPTPSSTTLGPTPLPPSVAPGTGALVPTPAPSASSFFPTSSMPPDLLVNTTNSTVLGNVTEGLGNVTEVPGNVTEVLGNATVPTNVTDFIGNATMVPDTNVTMDDMMNSTFLFNMTDMNATMVPGNVSTSLGTNETNVATLPPVPTPTAPEKTSGTTAIANRILLAGAAASLLLLL
jgi:hypothetical protein